MLAAQLFGTVGVAAVLLLAFATRAPRLLDVALVFAVLAAVAGVTLALAWVRLRAPDIALAEAAVGSGITGALLLSALARSRRLAQDNPAPKTPDP